MSDPTRRRLLAALAASTVPTAVAGCISRSDHVEHPDAPDLMLRNCDDRAYNLSVEVSGVDSGERVHDATHEVPADYCGDRGPSVNVKTVWSGAGEYRIRVSGDGLPNAEGTVTLSESDVEGKAGTRSIVVRNGSATIGP